MELEEAIKVLQAQLDTKTEKGYYKPMAEEETRVVLNHLVKQDKMIELMAEKVSHMVFIDDNHKVCMFANKEEAKQYFEKKGS